VQGKEKNKSDSSDSDSDSDSESDHRVRRHEAPLDKDHFPDLSAHFDVLIQLMKESREMRTLEIIDAIESRWDELADDITFYKPISTWITALLRANENICFKQHPTKKWTLDLAKAKRRIIPKILPAGKVAPWSSGEEQRLREFVKEFGSSRDQMRKLAVEMNRTFNSVIFKHRAMMGEAGEGETEPVKRKGRSKEEHSSESSDEGRAKKRRQSAANLDPSVKAKRRVISLDKFSLPDLKAHFDALVKLLKGHRKPMRTLDIIDEMEARWEEFTHDLIMWRPVSVWVTALLRANEGICFRQNFMKKWSIDDSNLKKRIIPQTLPSGKIPMWGTAEEDRLKEFVLENGSSKEVLDRLAAELNRPYAAVMRKARTFDGSSGSESSEDESNVK
jgi:hypothetical protein